MYLQVHFADDDAGEPNQIATPTNLPGLMVEVTKKCPHLCPEICIEQPPMCSFCDQATSPIHVCPSPHVAVDGVDAQSSHPHARHPERLHTPVHGNLECSHNRQTKNLNCRHTPVDSHRHTPTGHADSPGSPVHKFKYAVGDTGIPFMRSVGCCRTPTREDEIPHSKQSVHTQVHICESPNPCVVVGHASSLPSQPITSSKVYMPTRNVSCSPMVAHSNSHIEHSATCHIHDTPCHSPIYHPPPNHCSEGRKAPEPDGTTYAGSLHHDSGLCHTPVSTVGCPRCLATPALEKCCYHQQEPVRSVACQCRAPTPSCTHASSGYICPRCQHSEAHEHPIVHEHPVAHNHLVVHKNPRTDMACSPCTILTADKVCSPLPVVECACSPCPEIIEQTVTTGTTTVVYETTDAATSRIHSAAGDTDTTTSRAAFRWADAMAGRLPIIDLHRSCSGVPYSQTNASMRGAVFTGIDTATPRGTSSRRPSVALNLGASTSRTVKTVDTGTSRAPSVTFQVQDAATSNSQCRDVSSFTSHTRAVDLASRPYDRDVTNMAADIKNTIEV